MPAKPACFSPTHLHELDLAANLAADLVSEAYDLDFGNFRQWPVDIRHYPQLSDEEKRYDVLAQLFRYSRHDAVPKGGQPDFWRVCLYDPVILAAMEREALDLHSLLCYILTHELIHVSRFIRFMELFGLDKAARAREEEIVHAETVLLLSKLNKTALTPVLSLFQTGRLALDEK
ncbi:MAG: hypothetical protein LBJ64_00915 [Deltaproteobacteria bacterium]|jgi:hypothetical protein|nr:hypothetical protein [Deltaproteobacteria bacterium]